MSDHEISRIVEATIKSLKENGVIHVECPWKGIPEETVTAIKTIPSGAVRMLAMTWSVFSKFGQMAGHAIAVGALILLIALFCIGGLFLFKLGELFTGMGD